MSNSPKQKPSSRVRLDAVVRERHTLSWNEARRWIETGKIKVNGVLVLDPATPTDSGAAIELKMNAPKPREHGPELSGKALSKSDVLFLDEHIIAVNKPAGLSTVPFEEGETALEQLVCKFLKQPRIEIVQRLDRETSGVIVFARTPIAGRRLAEQFKEHTVVRRYQALVHGAPQRQTIRSDLVQDRGDGLRGSIRGGTVRERNLAKHAVTHVAVKKQFERFAWIECRLETGRTHQIRIHLSEAGHPLLGEKAYNREFRGDVVAAPRLMLHAGELGFVHPVTGTLMRWELPLPEDFASFVA